jgi:hypothetical protein
MGFDAVANLLHATPRICTQPIALIDKCNPRDAVLIRLAPNGFGLRLNPTNRAKHRYSPIKNTQAPFYFNGKVNVPRSVYDIYAVISPEAACRSSRDADSTLLFLLHPIHDRSAVMNFTHRPRYTRVKKNTLSGCGFPRIDMRHNPDVPGMIYGYLPNHDLCFFSALKWIA